MGYVKLFKADKTFDLLPADDIIRVKDLGTTVEFTYSGGSVCTVNMSAVAAGDVQKIVNAVLKIEGASGESIAPDALSVPITSIVPTRII